MPTQFALRILPALLAILMLAGCQRDETPPTWHLTSPIGLVADSATAVIRIAGSAEDESGLGSVDVVLLTESGSAINFEGEPLSGSSASFDFNYVLGNLYSPTGNYTLKVTVSDAKGNYSSEFLDVVLTEVPLRLSRELFAAEQPGGMFQLFALDAISSTSPATAARTLGNGLTGFAQDNSRHLLLTCSSEGHFFAYESFPSPGSDDFTQDCEHHFTPNAFEDGFRGIYHDLTSGRYYLPTGANPRCWVISGGCFTLPELPDVLLNVTCISGQDNSVYVGGTTTSGVHKLDRHDLQASTGGGLSSTAVLDWAPLFCGEGPDGTVLVGGNLGGTAQVAVLDGTSMALLGEGDGPGPLRDMAFGNGRAWCITALGLHEVSTTTGNLGPVLYAGGAFTCLEYEAATQTLYLGQPNGVEHLASDGSYIDSRVGITGDVKHIAFVRNK